MSTPAVLFPGFKTPPTDASRELRNALPISHVWDREIEIPAKRGRGRPKPILWLTPKEIRGRYAPHLSAAALTARLEHERCPNVRTKCGDSGRRVFVEVTERLVAFLALRRVADGLSLAGAPIHASQLPQHFPHQS